MEALTDKFWALMAAVISLLGGFYMYDRRVTNERLTKLEQDLSQTRIDVKEVETKFDALKEDTQEIKESQKDILKLLQRRKG